VVFREEKQTTADPYGMTSKETGNGNRRSFDFAQDDTSVRIEEQATAGSRSLRDDKYRTCNGKWVGLAAVFF
jgi:hypothetical protein